MEALIKISGSDKITEAEIIETAGNYWHFRTEKTVFWLHLNGFELLHRFKQQADRQQSTPEPDTQNTQNTQKPINLQMNLQKFVSENWYMTEADIAFKQQFETLPNGKLRSYQLTAKAEPGTFNKWKSAGLIEPESSSFYRVDILTGFTFCRAYRATQKAIKQNRNVSPTLSALTTQTRERGNMQKPGNRKLLSRVTEAIRALFKPAKGDEKTGAAYGIR